MLGNGLYSSEQISFKEAKPTTVSEEFNVTLKTYPPDLCPKRCCLMDGAYCSVPCCTAAPSTEGDSSLSRQCVSFFLWSPTVFYISVQGSIPVEHQKHLHTCDLIRRFEAGSKAGAGQAQTIQQKV